MCYNDLKHDDDTLKGILYRLRNLRGLDPAMRSPESLERFIRTHKILERGDEWVEWAEAARAVSSAYWNYVNITDKLLGDV